MAARLIDTLPNCVPSEMPPAAAVWRRRMYIRKAKSIASVYTIRLATANRKIEKPTERALATDSTIQPASSAQTASGASTDQDRRIFMSCRRGSESRVRRMGRTRPDRRKPGIQFGADFILMSDEVPVLRHDRQRAQDPQ